MSNNVDADIKPCPFCGSKAIMVYDKQIGYTVYCPNCEIQTSDYNNIEDCLAVWNRRNCDKSLLN